MLFWNDPTLETLLRLALLLYVAQVLIKATPLRRMNVPVSIYAGILGFLCGSSVLYIVELSQEALERIVYHGLAITFIGLGLCTSNSQKSSEAFRMGIGISTIAVLQGFVGLSLIVAWGLWTDAPQHPGFGLLLPLGFSQGPGQALSLGAAWEQTGLKDGAQLGLIVAAAGFLCSIVIGIPLAMWGRSKGLFVERDESQAEMLENTDGSLLSAIMTIGFIYMLTFEILQFVEGVVVDEKYKSMLWGFHFLVGLGLALLYKKQAFLNLPDPNNQDLTRVVNVTVDVVTCAALCAVQISIVLKYWLPVSVLAIAGSCLTLLFVLWLSSRGFEQDRFQHALLWFGAGTGTLPMGITLLRIIDPKLRSLAPISATVGSAVALLLSAPLMLFVLPYAVAQWPRGYPITGYLITAGLLVYLFGLLGLWYIKGLKLNFGPIWTDEEHV